MQRRQECVSFPELGNDCCRDRQPVIAVGRRIDCSHKSGAAIVSRCSPETEVSHQRSAVIETRLNSMRIEGVEARVDTELIRKIVDHGRRWLLVITQEPPRLSHCAKLNGEAQLVLRSPAEFAFQSICRVQCKVADQTILVRRCAQQYRRFLRADKASSTHSRSPLAHSFKGELAAIRRSLSSIRQLHLQINHARSRFVRS